MHIASIRVEGYRYFEDQTIEFNQGLNVIIGENNAGKTDLFDALKLIFECSRRDRPSVHDFHRCEKSEESAPPEIRASVTLRSDGNDTDDDLGTVATWLTTLDDEWEAIKATSHLLGSLATRRQERSLSRRPTSWKLRPMPHDNSNGAWRNMVNPQPEG